MAVGPGRSPDGAADTGRARPPVFGPSPPGPAGPRVPFVEVTRSRRYLISALAGLLMALLVTAAVLAARRQPEPYPAGSPEATVQAWYQALIDERPLDAHDQLTAELQDRCDPPSAAEVAGQRITRVTLDQTSIDGDRATVRITVTRSLDGGPLGLDESVTDQTVQLTRTAAGEPWRIAEQPWPWFACQRKG